jgi:hypothetical protein
MRFCADTEEAHEWADVFFSYKIRTCDVVHIVFDTDMEVDSSIFDTTPSVFMAMSASSFLGRTHQSFI